MTTTLDSLTVVLAYPVNPSTDTAVTTPVIFSSVPWAMASTDTFASLPSTSTFRSYDETAKWWRSQADGLFLPGGFIQHGGASITIDNRRRREGDDYVHPLDTYAGYRWAGAVVTVWAADASVSSSKITLDIAFASLTQVGTYVCENLSIGDVDATLRLREPDTRRLPATPWSQRGYGLMAECNTITLPDVAGIRGTGSFTLRMTGTFIGDTVVGPEIVWSSALVRLQRDEALLTWEIRAASGTWEGFTPTAILDVFPDIGTFHIRYNSVSHSATLYFRGGTLGSGEALETIEVTNGLYASATATDAVWIWGAVSGNQFWYCAGFSWLSIEESAEWVLDDGTRGVEDHPSMVVGLPFDEEVGTLCVDIVGTQDAVCVNSVRAATGEGVAAAAGSRLPAILGPAFGVPLQRFVESDEFVGGYAPDRLVRHVTQDGDRLEPTLTGTAATLVINAARDTLGPLMPAGNTVANSPLEFAVGQIVSTGSAVNTTPITISRVNVSPTIGAAQRPGSIRTSTDQTVDESTSLAVSSTGSEEYSVSTASIVRGATTYVIQTVTLDSAITDGVLQASYARHADDGDMSAIQHATEAFGPEQTAPTIAYESAAAEIWHHGIVVPGESEWGDMVDRLALSSPSVDAGTMAAYYEADGDIAYRGMRLDSDASDDFALRDKVKDIVPVYDSSVRSARVRVKYCENHQKLEISQSVGTTDDLMRELRYQWREAISGTGASIATFESTLMRAHDARLQATAFARIQKFYVYRVELHGPVSTTLLIAATNGPGLQTTITWDKDAFWAAGRVCWTVGWERRRQGSGWGLVLYVMTEKT